MVRKMRRVKSRFKVFLVCLFLLVLLSGFVSAGFFDWVRKTITGQASSQTTNLTITVSGDNPVEVRQVSLIDEVNPIDASSIAVSFTTVVYDPDGYQDINTSSIQANFSREGESVRQNNSCQLVSAGIDANSSNFSCSIKMWYWDETGQWDVTVRARDRGNATWVQNTSTNFSYSLTYALEVSPLGLTWPSVSPGDENQTSSTPTTINNTGNYNGTIDITAINILGESDSDQVIYAKNFTVMASADRSSSPDECAGNQTFNNTAVVVANSIANRGNLSKGGGVGQEEIYYCITQVPFISSQTYSTNQGGSWTISY